MREVEADLPDIAGVTTTVAGMFSTDLEDDPPDLRRLEEDLLAFLRDFLRFFCFSLFLRREEWFLREEGCSSTDPSDDDDDDDEELLLLTFL